MVKVGIVGCGGIARSHLPGIKSNPDVEVVAVADISEEVGREVAHDLGAEFYNDYRKLADEEIEAVFLFPRPIPRAEMEVFFAEQGRHIFSEKPIAINLEDAERIVNAVEKSGVKFMVGFVLHFFPAFRKLHELQNEGVLGELVTCWTRRIWRFGRLKETWYADPSQSGGMSVDYFGHDIDWLRWTGGEITSVYGWTKTVTEGIESEDNIWAMAVFQSGASGVIGGSWSSFLGDTSIGIIGTKGTGVISGQEVRIQCEGEGARSVPYENFHPFDAEDKHFIRAIVEDFTPEVSVYDGFRALEIALAIQESAKKGEVVHFGEGR